MAKSDIYRADVESRDRRSLRMRRSGAAVGAALLVWLAMWSSGFDRALLNWFKSRSTSVGAVALSYTRAVPAPPPPVILDKPQVQAFGGLRSSVSDTPERLILTGTIPGRNPHEGLAFIGIDARHPQTYSAGALLANGGRLMAIFPRYVVLQRGERQARLYLGGRDQKGRKSEDEVLIVGGRQTYTPAVANAKEEFTDFIRETPVYDGVTVRGFQVYPGRQASVFARMGLQPGDLIVSVDGATLSDPTEAVAVFRQLVEGTSETAEVIRGGRSKTVTLDGSLIASELEREQEATSQPGLSGAPPT